MRGIRLHKNLSRKGKIMTTFITILLVTAVIASLSPKAIAAPTIINSIDPTSGHVGDTVRVVGEIDTQNGSYAIFFGSENVKNGTAVDLLVNDTFFVPHRPKGDYNVTLQDLTMMSNYTSTFTIKTAYYIKAVPNYVREGNTTKICANVTGGLENTRYWANITVADPIGLVRSVMVQLTNTTSTGYGSGIRTYPTDFGSGATTNYVGVYCITFNETVATGNFTVGLTDKPEYRRGETLYIKGSGYYAYENVTVLMHKAGENITEYPKNITATEDGIITDSWTIPTVITPGIYTVTLLSFSTPPTNKTIPDNQDFTVLGGVYQIRGWNLAVPPEPVPNVAIAARDAETETIVVSEITNQTGWAVLLLDYGNYTFLAIWNLKGNYILVGTVKNQIVNETKTYELNMTCQLAPMWITVKDVAGTPLPLVTMTLTFNYTDYYGETYSDEISFETNYTEIQLVPNVLMYRDYKINASRHGYIFNTTYIANHTYPRWVNITCPTYTMFINAMDSKEKPLQNVQVNVTEWGSTTVLGPKTTDEWGSTTFSHTFGRYTVKVYTFDTGLGRTVVLNETVVDLIEDYMFVPLRCKLSNIDLSVVAVDYFGQPIPNAQVDVERKMGSEWVRIEPSRKTDSQGVVSLENIVGGDYRISVKIAGTVCAVESMYLDGSREVVFKVEKYVMLGPYPVETTQFTTGILLGVILVIFGLVSVFRKRLKKPPEKKTPPKQK